MSARGTLPGHPAWLCQPATHTSQVPVLASSGEKQRRGRDPVQDGHWGSQVKHRRPAGYKGEGAAPQLYL